MPGSRPTVPSLAPRDLPSALTAARARRAVRQALAAPADAPCCGWFDSSYELSQGLLVTEHRELDDPATLAMAVGMALDTAFGDWLQ